MQTTAPARTACFSAARTGSACQSAPPPQKGATPAPTLERCACVSAGACGADGRFMGMAGAGAPQHPPPSYQASRPDPSAMQGCVCPGSARYCNPTTYTCQTNCPSFGPCGSGCACPSGQVCDRSEGGTGTWGDYTKHYCKPVSCCEGPAMGWLGAKMCMARWFKHCCGAASAPLFPFADPCHSPPVQSTPTTCPLNGACGQAGGWCTCQGTQTCDAATGKCVYPACAIGAGSGICSGAGGQPKTCECPGGGDFTCDATTGFKC